jgi:hypothetical protein
MGDDIKMHAVVGLAYQALVGHFHGHKVGEASMRSWLKDFWAPHTKHILKFFLLSQGLLGFLFRT